MSTSLRHRRLLRQVNAELKYCRFLPEDLFDPATEQSEYDHLDQDDDNYVERCDGCGAETDGCGNFDECSICHAPGCERCLISGDDLYPSLCTECAGEE